MTNNQLTDRRISELLESATEYDLTAFAKNDDLALALRELQERRMAAMDGEPIVFTDERNLHHIAMGRETSLIWGKQNHEAGDIPLFRHAKPAPVVPDDVMDALQKVARIRLDLNDFDGDCRGIADCLSDAEEALIEVVNRRAAMLNGGKS